MRTTLLFTVAFFIFNASTALAQEEQPEGPWTKGAGIGLDFAQLLRINPKVGSGQNNLGLGGVVNFFANYKEARLSWDNSAAWQFGIQKQGSGILSNGEKIPFQKSTDEIRLNSKVGFKTSDNSKFSYAADFGFLSLIAPAYPGPPEYPGQLLSNIQDTTAIARFFSPATINFSVGIDYKPIEQLSFFYSPAGYKGIYVLSDEIAALNIQGNEPGKNTDHQLGSFLKATYKDKVAKEKIILSSVLNLFSNYLRDPQNVDIDWQNQVDFVVVKNLNVTLLLNVFYDHDMLVQITDRNAPGGTRGTGRRVSFTEQLLIKYNVSF